MALIRCLISALPAKPSEQVGIKAHGNDFFRCGQDDFGGLPELRIWEIRQQAVRSQ